MWILSQVVYMDDEFGLEVVVVIIIIIFKAFPKSSDRLHVFIAIVIISIYVLFGLSIPPVDHQSV